MTLGERGVLELGPGLVYDVFGDPLQQDEPEESVGSCFAADAELPG